MIFCQNNYSKIVDKVTVHEPDLHAETHLSPNKHHNRIILTTDGPLVMTVIDNALVTIKNIENNHPTG